MIISLTSIPPRFLQLGPVLWALAHQSAAAVWLWIPENYDRFPDWDGSPPDVPDGITLRRCATDFGPATKTIPTLQNVPDDARVLICDDDVIYGPDWAAGFQGAARRHPDDAIAASTFPVKRLGVAASPSDVIAQGFAGICLAGNMIPMRTIKDRDKWVDDIWVSAMIAASGTRIRTAPYLRSLSSPIDAPASLQDAEIGNQTRADANRQSAIALAQELGIWGAA